MASRRLELTFSTRDGQGFRDAQVTHKRLCSLCGDWKDEAFDVCWHPDVPCHKDRPEDSA